MIILFIIVNTNKTTNVNDNLLICAGHRFPFRHTTAAGVPQTDGQQNSSLYEVQDSGAQGNDHLSQLTIHQSSIAGFNYFVINLTLK